jgi:hypothetical protein
VVEISPMGIEVCVHRQHLDKVYQTVVKCGRSTFLCGTNQQRTNNMHGQWQDLTMMDQSHREVRLCNKTNSFRHRRTLSELPSQIK